MHKLKASRRTLNVEPPPVLVSRRWLGGDVQMSEHISQQSHACAGDERKCTGTSVRVSPLAGCRFMSERQNPSGFPGNVGLDDVSERFVCAKYVLHPTTDV